MSTKQPEALRLADTLDLLAMDLKPPRLAASELRRLHAENETLRTGYDAARLEIESLKQRVQELGQMARDVNSRRVIELEAQLEAVGAGGVEPLRQRCLHQISEPQAQPVGTARQFIEWAKAQPQDREPTTLYGALAEFEANFTSQPAAQVLAALKQVCAIAVSAAKTNSRDIADWREDMDRIATIAAHQGAKP